MKGGRRFALDPSGNDDTDTAGSGRDGDTDRGVVACGDRGKTALDLISIGLPVAILSIVLDRSWVLEFGTES